ncbi:hypothetical protein BG74_04585 [Sodalis-like endosymbiont of Proechinophthirus fluctus]|nr:hypothetical protein BG74_04585 [Sodalis-like endosymbiont of Proechinophthirus fluctus]
MHVGFGREMKNMSFLSFNAVLRENVHHCALFLADHDLGNLLSKNKRPILIHPYHKIKIVVA